MHEKIKGLCTRNGKLEKDKNRWREELDRYRKKAQCEMQCFMKTLQDKKGEFDTERNRLKGKLNECISWMNQHRDLIKDICDTHSQSQENLHVRIQKLGGHITAIEEREQQSELKIVKMTQKIQKFEEKVRSLCDSEQHSKCTIERMTDKMQVLSSRNSVLEKIHSGMRSELGECRSIVEREYRQVISNLREEVRTLKERLSQRDFYIKSLKEQLDKKNKERKSVEICPRKDYDCDRGKERTMALTTKVKSYTANDGCRDVGIERNEDVTECRKFIRQLERQNTDMEGVIGVMQDKMDKLSSVNGILRKGQGRPGICGELGDRSSSHTTHLHRAPQEFNELPFPEWSTASTEELCKRYS